MTPKGREDSSKTRTVEAEIEIAAPAEAVWKALTDADELTRWFPLTAEVTPGEGGRLWLGWGDLAEWEHRIEIWEPGVHLRTRYSQPSPTERPLALEDVEGRAPEERGTELAVDYFLEAREGRTVLRVVHSGFGAETSWDSEYHGVRRGWRYELRSLRHYLERHPGVARQVAWAKKLIDISMEEAWERLMSPDALLSSGTLSGLEVGGRYQLRSTLGRVFKGVVQTLDPPFEFSGTVENLGDSLFRVAAEMIGSEATVIIWLSTYGLSRVRVGELEAEFKMLLERLFSS